MSGTETGGGVRVGVEDRLVAVALRQFEPEGELVAGDVAGIGDGYKPEARSEVGTEFVIGAVVEAVGGPWPEAVAGCGTAVAGGGDDAGAEETPLRSY